MPMINILIFEYLMYVNCDSAHIIHYVYFERCLLKLLKCPLLGTI